jgi:hypothetical protein
MAPVLDVMTGPASCACSEPIGDDFAVLEVPPAGAHQWYGRAGHRHTTADVPQLGP